jgi:hypothetical protein
MSSLTIASVFPATSTPAEVTAALSGAAEKLALFARLATRAIEPRAAVIRQYGYHKNYPIDAAPLVYGTENDDEPLPDFCEGLALALDGAAHGQPVDPVLKAMGSFARRMVFCFDHTSGVDGPVMGFTLTDLCRSTWAANGTLHLTPSPSPFRLTVLDIDMVSQTGGFINVTEAAQALAALQAKPTPAGLQWKAWFEGKGPRPQPEWDGDELLNNL